jgi:hypothetical protein
MYEEEKALAVLVLTSVIPLVSLSYISWTFANMYMTTNFEIWISFLASMLIVLPLTELITLGGVYGVVVVLDIINQ